MKRAVCTSDITLSVLGSRESVRIGHGTEVDLDLVVGESAGAPLSLAEALGPHVVHFKPIGRSFFDDFGEGARAALHGNEAIVPADEREE